MKEKMTAKGILIPTVSLFVICLVVTALLAVTNMLTTEPIKAAAAQKENAAKTEVLSVAKEFSEAKAHTITLADGTTEDVTYYQGTAEDGSLAGYVFKTHAKGYGGDIKVMVGVGTDGKVTGISFLEISETAGLGMNAKTPDFQSRFVGKSGTIGVAKNNPTENEIQALTGATITSKAVTSAVNTALEIYGEIGGDNIG